MIDILLQPRFFRTAFINSRRKPTVEVMQELREVIHNPRDKVAAIFFLSNMVFGLTFTAYLFWFLTLSSFAFVAVSIFLVGTIYNTVWYHRFCSHRAFSFRRNWCRALLL